MYPSPNGEPRVELRAQVGRPASQNMNAAHVAALVSLWGAAAAIPATGTIPRAGGSRFFVFAEDQPAGDEEFLPSAAVHREHGADHDEVLHRQLQAGCPRHSHASSRGSRGCACDDGYRPNANRDGCEEIEFAMLCSDAAARCSELPRGSAEAYTISGAHLPDYNGQYERVQAECNSKPVYQLSGRGFLLYQPDQLTYWVVRPGGNNVADIADWGTSAPLTSFGLCPASLCPASPDGAGCAGRWTEYY